MPEVETRPGPAARPSGRRGRRHGVEIRPGSVKQARMEAGMSLGQVANGVVSRTAIYFVETGKAKPSIETLRLIAEGTGRPLDFFLGHEASAAYLLEDPHALRLAERGLEICRSLQPVSRTTEARLLFVLGSVHIVNQDWQAAVDSYERAIAAGSIVQDLRRLSMMYG